MSRDIVVKVEHLQSLCDIAEQHQSDNAAVQAVRKLLQEHETKEKNKKIASDLWAAYEAANGKDIFSYYYFTLKLTEDGYELYLCYKAHWFECNEAFPWMTFVWRELSNDEQLLAEIVANSVDYDQNLYWFDGDEQDMLSMRERLLSLGLEEKPDLLKNFCVYDGELYPDR